MTKKTKAWLIVAITLILIGAILFVGVMTVFGWNFRRLSTVEYVTKSYEITESFRNILIDTETLDIEFLPSGNEKTIVECYELKKTYHSVSVVDDTLTITLEDKAKNWFIGINFDTPKIIVYMPRGEYSDLTVKATTGDVRVVKDFSFKNVEIKVTTGDLDFEANATDKIIFKGNTGDMKLKNVSAQQIDLSHTTGETYLTNVKCENLVSSGTTGDASLKNVIVKEKLSVERSTGDITIDGCDAGELYLKATTGDITGSLLTDKVFVAKSTTGDIDVPQGTTGGKCEIKVTTGDIKIKIK